MLKKKPNQTELNTLIHVVNSGDYVTAETLATPLSKIYPKAVLIWKILGVAIAEQGRMAEAIAPMQKVIQLEPKDAEAHRNLGTALKEIGNTASAETCFRKAISLNPQDPIALVSLAKILNENRSTLEAEKLARKAIAIQYDMADAHDQLGVALLAQKKCAEAENSFKQAIMLNPAMANAHNNLGITQNEQGHYAEAEASYRRAIALNPQFANAYNNLGTNFINLNLLEKAEVAYRHAINIDQQHNTALSNLGRLLHLRGNQAEAKTILEQALLLQPDSSETLNSLGNVHKDLGDCDTAIRYYRAATDLDSHALQAYSNLLLISGYHARLTKEQLLQESVEYGRRVASQIKSKYSVWPNLPDLSIPSTKIRIGFVSGDLRKHAVMFFLEGLLRNIDKSKFELIAYSTYAHEDEVTARIKTHFMKWQPLYGKNDQDAATLIYQDAPHILFDLSGHTAHNRLPIFAYKPAPIQITWIGYPATSGIAEMDYILGDQYLVPFGMEHQFIEKVWRFPEVTGCFTPLIENIPVKENLPATQNGFITFGCFNNLIKMNDDVVATWSKILKAIPTSRLYLQAQQLSEPSVLQQTYDRYAAHDIGAERLILEGKTPRLDYFHSYNKIDIALDPFPCPGGTTTADTLWMSVPVLTMRGQNYWSRIGESLAYNVGQADWIAKDEDDYIRKAVAFSADIKLLEKLREELRDRVVVSPLFDARRFALHFENAIEGMIKNYRDENKL